MYWSIRIEYIGIVWISFSAVIIYYLNDQQKIDICFVIYRWIYLNIYTDKIYI